MSANTELAPDLLLRSYIWAVLKANDPTTWDETKYGGMVPIVPLAEEPELEDFTGPHIVYGYTEDTSGDLWAKKAGSMTLAIYDDNFRRLGKTINTLTTALERHDETATDVNNYTSLMPTFQTTDDPEAKAFLGVRFGCIYIGFVEGGVPETQEGGRQSGLINIRYDYIADYEDNVVTDVLPSI